MMLATLVAYIPEPCVHFLFVSPLLWVGGVVFWGISRDVTGVVLVSEMFREYSFQVEDIEGCLLLGKTSISMGIHMFFC